MNKYEAQTTRYAAAYWYAVGYLDALPHRERYAGALEFVDSLKAREAISGGITSPVHTVQDAWKLYLQRKQAQR